MTNKPTDTTPSAPDLPGAEAPDSPAPLAPEQLTEAEKHDLRRSSQAAIQEVRAILNRRG